MKGKRVIAAILLVGILAATLAGCKNEDISKKETEKPVITLGSDNYPPYNYLNEDGISTGIDVELATEAFKRMGYQVDVVQINWEKKKELVESGDAKTMPIIVMTANAFTEDRIRAKEAGMDEHISKPVDAKLLVKVIYELAEHSFRGIRNEKGKKK